ncbi:hypothetical protein [Streptomyces sp. NBC_01538]|uniref:hypothetical protein n=1 Tax=Streptomyces sp. NBC_01538 TaxID=2903897 RepID=UPI0038667C43
MPLLLVRVFPDDIHLDAHDTELTPREEELRREFLVAVNAGRDRIDFVRAWEHLIRAVGHRRAAWIARMAKLGKVPIVPDRIGRAPRAALLPDRWQAYATLPGGQVVSGESKLISEPLDVGPDPFGGPPGWLTTYARAEEAGMALTVELPTPIGRPRVDRLVVLGAHVTRDADASRQAFEALLDAHHHTVGLSFVRPGAPTNALPGERPDHTSRPDVDQVFAVEGDMWPLIKSGQTLVDDPIADGVGTAELLGLDPAVFAHVEGADRRTGAAAAQVRRLLADAVTGTLRHLWAPVLTAGDLDVTASYFADAVEGLGPMPALRVGDQPYGILPVSVIIPEDFDLDPFEVRLLTVLRRLREWVWEPSVAAVPAIGGQLADPAGTLLALLRSDGVTQTLALRALLGPDVSAVALRRLEPGRAAALGDELQLVSGLAASLAADLAAQDVRLAAMIAVADAPSVTVPFVGEDPHTELDQLSFRYPSTLTALWELLDPGPFSGSLLGALARTALLSSADRATRTLLRQAGTVDDATVAAWDAELSRNTILYTLDHRLAMDIPDHPGVPLSSLLLNASPAGAEPFITTLAAVRELAVSTGYGTARGRRHPRALLDVVLRSELGLLSHRLDAWLTAVTTQRLRRLRAMPGRERGLIIGAYGVLTNLGAGPSLLPVDVADLPEGGGEAFLDAANAGYLHTPGVAHAATAAVLRSVHLGQRPGAGGEAFSVDLSSRRVRDALGLLDGIREGQPLAALLGYRMERALRDRGTPQAIAVIRRAAPLAANKLNPQGPAEYVAADNVVDALRLIALTEPGIEAAVRTALAPHFGTLGAAETSAVVRAVAVVVADAKEAADSVADVLLAEGVFQLVRGNPTRGAASVDALSGTGSPPPEPEVISQPRTGIALTLRAAVTLPATPSMTPPGVPLGSWADTPRSRLEPALERWAQAVLPAPSDVQISADRTLADLLSASPLAAIDFVAGNPETLAARLSPAEPPNPSLVEAFTVAATLRALLSAARPLFPRDTSVEAEPALARVDAAVHAVRMARDAVRAAKGPAALVDALYGADLVGATNAVPPGDATPDEVKALAVAVAAELDARLAAHDALATPSADDVARADWAAERAKAAFGPTGWVVPAVSGLGGGTPEGISDEAVALVVGQRARVRPGVARLDRVLGCVEALHGDVPRFTVAQTPLAPGERWIALTRPLGGRTSVFAYTPFPGEPGPIAALVVDDWVEVVPAADVTTSLAFHYNAPTSAPPNVALLGVLKPNAEQWSARAALAIVEEGLALARLRAVDPSTLATTGQLLPALIARVDTEPGVSAGPSITDLTAR